MNTLIFDTATALEIVVLDAGGRVFTNAVVNNGNHSALLFDSINSMLKLAGLSARDIGLVAVGIGPGSFTGVRVAVSAARALAQALKSPIAGIMTHDMYAASVAAGEGEAIIVVFDAKKDRVFGGLYLVQCGLPAALVTPGDYTIDELLKKCSAFDAVYVVGDGVDKYKEEICRLLKNPRIITDDFALDGIKISAIVKKEFENGNFADYNSVVPFYARKPDAKLP